VILPIEPPPRLLAISANGRVALVRWEFAGQQPGVLERFLPSGLEGDPIVALAPLPMHESSDLSLGLLSSDGRFKRLPLAEVLDLSGRATSVVKLKDGVQLKAAVICREHHDLILVSDIGRMLRLPINEDVLPLMGRLAQGPMTMRLLPGEQLIGALCPLEPTVLLVSEQGQFARIDLTSIRSSQRGDLGSMAIQITGDTDRITGITETSGLIGIVSTEQRHGRIDPTTLEITDPGDAFSNQIELHQGEAITVLVPQISS
jgi:DNA gyrase subunit A